ncbi:MAG: hypothetical protein AB1714_02995 [Acidobacteriota bacterium]
MIPADRLDRNPLITEAGYGLLKSIQQHPDAPYWSYVVGDRVRVEDLPLVEAYRRALFEQRPGGSPAPSPQILDWVRAMRSRARMFRRHIPEGMNLERDWAFVPTMAREDIATRIEDIVPWDEDISRMIVYDTSGTTGHAIVVPYHPRTMAQNHPLIEYALEQHGVRPHFGPDGVACFNVGAQATTVVFANVFSVWNQAGFAKVNLHPRGWRDVENARRFFSILAPQFLTGDPMGFAELMRWKIPIRPAAMVSTAVALGSSLKSRLEAHFRCPVIDYYSTTETGPVACSDPGGRGLVVFPPDVFVEVVDADGYPAARGEITVTGGRNPYLPLLRYRTGDFARMSFEENAEGRVTARLLDLEAREAVMFRATDGSPICPVDIGRIIREYPIVQHEFVQRADGSCDLALRPVPGGSVDTETLAGRLAALFGVMSPIDIRLDPALGERMASGKVQPFRSELAV